ncbi:hypothetical protein J4233_04210 [Candidatus Pacearchaeota archaeon]|nr:hypothetical protein [Candidatus Pacearchaeota archaeon]
MNGFGEIPRYVRYDFLITFIALVLMSSAWYFSSVNNIPREDTNIFYLVGIPLAIWGFGEMYNNYREGRDLRQLQIIMEKKEIFDELTKHKILDADKKVFFIEELRKEIDEIIEKKNQKD